MPVEWVRCYEGGPADPGSPLPVAGGPPLAEVHLWPHRSLPNQGFVAFIALTAGLVALPLLAVLGTPVLWGLLPFIVLAVAGVWYALRRSTRDGRILEQLSISPTAVELVRREARGRVRDWQANPHWVRPCLHDAGPVEAYLTLEGGGRTVELGAFLTPDERRALHDELRRVLAALR